MASVPHMCAPPLGCGVREMRRDADAGADRTVGMAIAQRPARSTAYVGLVGSRGIQQQKRSTEVVQPRKNGPGWSRYQFRNHGSREAEGLEGTSERSPEGHVRPRGFEGTGAGCPRRFRAGPRTAREWWPKGKRPFVRGLAWSIGIVQVQLHVHGGLPRGRRERGWCAMSVAALFQNAEVSCGGPACVIFALDLKFWSQGGPFGGLLLAGSAALRGRH